MKKILITGGNGFIARNLYENLKGKYDVKTINHQELDLLDSPKVFDYVNQKKFDVVIHSATYDAAPKHSVKDPAKVLDNNLRMFFNIARCRDYFGKMIYFGSGAEFSREHWIPKMKENYFDEHVPKDQYGFSKYVMTKYTKSNENIINLRLFAVVGRNDDWKTRFIPNACCQAMEKETIDIHQNAFYDYLDVDDLTRVVDWFINNNSKEKVYNVCSGKTYDRRSLAEKIVKISGEDLKINIQNKEIGKEYSGDNSLLLNELGNFEFTPIDDSIKRLYEWYKRERNE
ncbi:MAG: NAD(P)-dependent oxidoreductase [Candidatus Nanoarchaeia archaeon]|nr:NAD(P)-dependent oxidoreductase [Candidatus Nanoarchaeia archaeon]MDD5358111.1 NAD(P)-dependent oxidoreductase [Candidatus Nanoarchaeia archaeon]MDD5589298.1 NAD(P)-dependent oxidoreductase [Candidatus Nanoarchaeia archaeon]